jgi:hypothetical protein
MPWVQTEQALSLAQATQSSDVFLTKEDTEE